MSHVASAAPEPHDALWNYEHPGIMPTAARPRIRAGGLPPGFFEGAFDDVPVPIPGEELRRMYPPKHVPEYTPCIRNGLPSAEDAASVAAEQETADRAAAPNATDRATDFVARSLPIFSAEETEDEEDDDAVATVCLTADALDAWWSSLTVEQKSQALANHYEAEARYAGRVHLTPVGAAALNEQVPA